MNLKEKLHGLHSQKEAEDVFFTPLVYSQVHRSPAARKSRTLVISERNMAGRTIASMTIADITLFFI